MKARWISTLLLLGLLFSLSGCKQTLPVVEDTYPTAVSWGNSYAAEQGGYYAMRGEQKGKTGLILYNKTKQKTHFLLEGAVCNIGLYGNKIYYQLEEDSGLYVYDLAAKKSTELNSDVASYQIYNGVLYYLKTGQSNYYFTVNLETGAKNQVTTSNTVNTLYLTEYGLYYYDDTKDFLMVRPSGNPVDRIVYTGIGETVRCLYSAGGADVLFLSTNDTSRRTTLLYYKAADNQVQSFLSGDYSNFNYTGTYAVMLINQTIYAVDPISGKTYIWGTVDEGDPYEIMRDSVILYTGNQAGIQYYPEDKTGSTAQETQE